MASYKKKQSSSHPVLLITLLIAITSIVFFVFIYANNAAPGSHAADKAADLQILEVKNTVDKTKESVTLYNNTSKQLDLRNYDICNKDQCGPLTGTIDSSQSVEVSAHGTTQWFNNGLDALNDMVGLKYTDPNTHTKTPEDSMNWGNPTANWRNYDFFKDMIWTDSLKGYDNLDVTFFRMGAGRDTNTKADWLTTSKPASKVQPPAQVGSTTVEITDVFAAANPQDQWFQLYNMTKGALTLTNFSICTSKACANLPTTTIAPFSLAKFKASALMQFGWPKNGLDAANDMLCLESDTDRLDIPVDCVNWGTPSTAWTNYNNFKAMLWNPGIKPPDSTKNQSFFRMAIGKDTDQASDWLTTTSDPAPVQQEQPQQPNQGQGDTSRSSVVGDLTHDGKVTNADVTAWIQAVKKTKGITDTSKGFEVDSGVSSQADINGDGKLDYHDFAALRQSLLNK